jgi:hypothetical protein
MLIVRNKSQYDLSREQLEEQAGALDVDYLEFDELDADKLAESIDGIWETELGNSDNLLDINVFELMEQLRNAILGGLNNQLDNQYVFGDRPEGLNEETGIYYEAPPPEYVVRRRDAAGNIFEFRLEEGYGYSIDMLQGNFVKYGYQVGIGNNDIRVEQSR